MLVEPPTLTVSPLCSTFGRGSPTPRLCNSFAGLVFISFCLFTNTDKSIIFFNDAKYIKKISVPSMPSVYAMLRSSSIFSTAIRGQGMSSKQRSSWIEHSKVVRMPLTEDVSVTAGSALHPWEASPLIQSRLTSQLRTQAKTFSGWTFQKANV